MKNIVIFSNPFGNGPAGKAVSIAKYIASHSDSNVVTVYVCGSIQLFDSARENLHFIKIDDRDEAIISKILATIGGSIYVISSQNRFAIRVARAKGIPCAFLDGLAWFWKDIPPEHFQADIIFWLNYPGILEKIPPDYQEKIKIVHGITEEFEVPVKRSLNEVLLYIGGCKNPLTPLPTHYLDLCAAMIEYFELQKDRSVHMLIATDSASKEYLCKYQKISCLLHVYEHQEFLSKLSEVRTFITNGGQTAAIEAAALRTPTAFYLPINLSQYALTSQLKAGPQSCLQWKNYVEIPDAIVDYTEKEAVAFFDLQAANLLQSPANFSKVCGDFRILLSQKRKGDTNDFFEHIGFTGTRDIFYFLKQKWRF